MTFKEAERAPAARGLNLIEIVQLPPVGTPLPHVLVMLKSPAFVPVSAILLIDNAAVPGFDRIMFRAALLVPTF